jgi:hypothetical protein
MEANQSSTYLKPISRFIYTITFKSGNSINVPIKIAYEISSMINNPSNDLQCFVGNDELLIIRLSEIVTIN